MNSQGKQLASPFSTGSGGANFEIHVQSLFALLMLAGGVAPCIPPWPIIRMKLQGRYDGFNTDDCILFTREPNSTREAKVLTQIKHSVNLTKNDKTFSEVLQAAWNDYTNHQLFNRQSDALVLITAPLSSAEIENGRTILEWARHSENAAEFVSKVEKANFSNDSKRQKLDAFRHQLQKIHPPLSDEELWLFMKRFYVLSYDFDVKSGADLSLVLSLIIKSCSSDPQKIWGQIVDDVIYANQNAGTLTLDTMSRELVSSFSKREVQTIPSELSRTEKLDAAQQVVLSEYATEVAMAMLLGSWDESYDNDMRACEKQSDSRYGDWIAKLRQVVLQPKSPLTQRDRKWKISGRQERWNEFGPRIFDEHLDRLKDLAVSVLREPDPKFELPKEDRFAARVHGKIPTHSARLRSGLAESLALLGSHPKALSSCSLHKPEFTAAICVREILRDADWRILASLSEVMPLLAEASPTEFLDAIETIVRDRADTIQSIFQQEGNGLGGWNYMTGILWGLETLAWHEDYLTRVTVLLGRLSRMDPGGSWANRPENSLTTMFLPWLPQTGASVQKRKTAVETLLREAPEVGWRVLLSLLPNTHRVTSGSHKPTWRKLIPDDLAEKLSVGRGSVSNKEYYEQSVNYSSMALSSARGNISRLTELIPQLDHLPEPAYSDTLGYLSSDEIVNLPEETKTILWETLVGFVAKHRKFSDTDWALPETEVVKIEHAANLLMPASLDLLYRRLFSSHEPELYEEKGNYEEQRRKVEERRTKAVETLFQASGIVGVFGFARTVSSPVEVGLALGRSTLMEIDGNILPSKLLIDEKPLKDLASGYVWAKFHRRGWGWVDGIDLAHWSNQEKSSLFTLLPFGRETWTRVKSLLRDDEQLYWKAVDARPYQLKDELHEATAKLLAHNRPRAAIQCLQWMLYEKLEPSIDQVCEALLANLSSDEPPVTLDHHNTTELIKWLQNNPNANVEVLGKIEWVYLAWLDNHLGLEPRTLERQLADNPEFFSEVIRLVFRPEGEKEPVEEPSEDRKRTATNAYDLLYKWRIVPGTAPDGSVDANKLQRWLSETKRLCEASGHLKIALDQVGKVCAYSPKDPSDLWIHKAVAQVLNEEHHEIMREAYRVELFNKRGSHSWTAGEDERNLAADFRQKAGAVEKEGYFRLATTLRELADSYDRDAERQASRDPFEE